VSQSVDDIAAESDPVLRNLLITQRYHELAVQLRDAGIGEDATWCAFAVWASKTAGATIRGEVLPERARQAILDSADVQDVLEKFNHGMAGWAVKHLSQDHLGRAIEAVSADVASAIADGNVLVFAELAPVYTALLAAHGSSDPPNLRSTTDAFAPTESELAKAADMSPVATAFGAYRDALFSPPDGAAMILQANVLAVAHEQQRLQPAIQRALNAAISDTLQKVIQDHVVRHVPTPEARAVLDKVTVDLCHVMDSAWDTALTESIMQLVTANETLDLRRDVPPLKDQMFPAALADLAGTDAATAVGAWDKTKGTGTPSGARDWADLPQRMNFIVNLFRSRQHDPDLFSPPFTPAQQADLAQRQIPPGPL
jgi:hypothetical protein